uniref:LIM domain-containing protein D n=2 Tax=Aceria tosichella TaxID=561515 RepID=A0A6G1SMT9_9ACAR
MTIQFDTNEQLFRQRKKLEIGDKLELGEQRRRQARTTPPTSAITGLQLVGHGGGGASFDATVSSLLQVLQLAAGSLLWALVQLLAKLLELARVTTSIEQQHEAQQQLEAAVEREAATRSPSLGAPNCLVGDCSRVARLNSQEKNCTRPAEEQRATETGAEPTRPTRIPPVKMTEEIVAGFEEQQVAHELSAQVVEEALQAVMGKLLLEPASANETANDEPIDVKQQEATANEREMAADDELAIDEKTTTKRLDDSPSLDVGIGSDGSLGAPSSSSSGPDDDEDDNEDDEAEEHCGRQASQINLRQLRLSALEDVLVCDQSRHSTSAARRLFKQLSTAATSSAKQTPTTGGGHKHRHHHQVENNRNRLATVTKKTTQKGSLASSRSSCGAGDNQSDDEINSSASINQQLDDPDNRNYLDELLGYCNSGRTDQDCGLIKLDRRCCSSSSSSSVNFGRTLVCSVSPTGQFNYSSTNRSNNNNNNLDKTMNIHEQAHGPNQECDDDDLSYYAINGDEIRHCRTAFRENRRLIERAQSEALARQRETASVDLSRTGSQSTIRTSQSNTTERSSWADSLGRRSRLPVCSRCQQKLYPVDKMELDFTRTTLNIHRNCFKCQVCSTLLRLETYASIDAKLYCPAHVKCVTPSR